MIRALRKYKRPIIIVGLPVLLVIFLVPGAITGLTQVSAQRARAVARFVDTRGDEVSVSNRELAEAQLHLRILHDADQMFASVMRQSIFQFMGLPPVEEGEHWFLLSREARDAGVVGGPGDGRTMLQRAFGGEPGELDALAATIAGRSGASNVRDVYNAFAEARGISRLVELYAGGAQLSDRRLAAEGLKFLRGVDARILVIPARSDRDDLPEPTEEQLQAQLTAYADKSPGEGDMGFGYRLPNRVRLEWLEIDALGIGAAMDESPRLASLELRKYWVAHKADFPVPGVADPSAAKFEDVAERVRAIVKKQVTDELMAEIVRYVDGEVTRVTRDLPRGPDGYLVLPEDWSDRGLNFARLAEDLQAFVLSSPNFQVRIPIPRVEREPEWKAATDAMFLPGVGRATTNRFGGAQAATLRDIVNNLKEFGAAGRGMFVQQGVPERLGTPNGSVYLVRVIDVDPARPAATVDEARDLLVADLKKKADYDRLASNLEELRRRAVVEGLAALADEYEAIPPREITSLGVAPLDSPLTRFGYANASLPQPVGRDEAAVGVIVARGHELLDRLEAEGGRLEDLTIGERTVVTVTEAKLAVVIAQFTELRPLVREDMAELSGPVTSMIIQDEFGDANPLAQLFSREALIERFAFKFVGEDGEALPEQPAADEAAASTGG